MPTPGENATRQKPPLFTIVNLNDFEQASRQSLTEKSWAFISGASEDNLTRDANQDFFRRIWFRPKALIGANSVNMRSSILGCETSLPIFISPADLATSAGAEGELALGRGAAATGIIYCVSNLGYIPRFPALEIPSIRIRLGVSSLQFSITNK
jgi:L-lactate dehydrogenase (cytochrome)